MDHDSDEELVRVDAKAAEAIDLHCDQGPVACIQVSSLSARMLLIGSSPSCLMRLVYRAAAHPYNAAHPIDRCASGVLSPPTP